MTYRIAPFLMTFNDLQGHFTYHKPFKVQFFIILQHFWPWSWQTGWHFESLSL